MAASNFQQLTFPDLNTESGARLAMLLAEHRTPFQAGYDAAQVRVSMQAFNAIIDNRLQYPQINWGVSNATNAFDIIGAPGQFDGFSRTATGVALAPGQRKVINDIIKFSNAKNAKREQFRELVNIAREVVAGPVRDPFEGFGGTFGIRTLGSADPGGFQIRIPDPNGVVQGNRFFTLRGIDLVFVIDSTGSMRDDVAAVKSAAGKIIQAAIKTTDPNKDAPNVRFAVITYKDPGETRVNLAFTRDSKQAQQGINSISVGGGGDDPEGVNSGLLAALNGSQGLWRASPMKRSIILMGDAPAKDTDLADQVTSQAQSNQVEIDDRLTTGASPNAVSTRALHRVARPFVGTLRVPASRVPIFAVAIGDDATAKADFRAIAEATNGQVFVARSAANVVDALSGAISAIVAPSVDREGPTVVSVEASRPRRGSPRLVLTFNEELDPVRASDLLNYSLAAPGRDKTLGTSDDRAVVVRSATYNPQTHSVAISVKARNLPKGPYRLVVNGTASTGVVDLALNLLDGELNGLPGGNFVSGFKRFEVTR